MDELAVWWIALEAVGVAAFPLTFTFFHRLPDRGFAFSKVIGLTLLAYALWMGSVLGLFPNARGTVILLVAALASLSLLVAGRDRDAIASYLRSGWRYVLLVEAMFALVLAAAVYLRSFVPDIDSGEKPFELAFLNSVNRADSFPPPDPWLSGHTISYYYFGYVVVSVPTKLTALATEVTFLLGLSTMAALAWTAAFGLAYNLVASRGGRGGPPPLSPRPVVFGIAAAVLVPVVSNLEGVFELMARHGIGSHGFYDALGLYGIPDTYDCAAAPADCSEWYPTRNYWWWWATRMGSNYDIQEFPFFSFHFGDLHAHVMAMPMLITLFAVAHQLLAAHGDLDWRWLLRNPWRFLAVVLLAGGIAFTDAWAAPLAASLLLAAVGAAAWRSSGRPLLGAAAAIVAFAVPLVAGMLLLYLPFYLDLETDTDGIAVAKTAFTSGAVPQQSETTRPLHFLLFWGPLLWVLLPFVGVYLRSRRRDALRWRPLGLAVLVSATPLTLWAALVAAGERPDGLAAELEERGANLITVAFIAIAATAVALAFLHAVRHATDGQGRADQFAFLIAGFALLMLLGAELYYVRDALGFRANTVFRFWHQGWTLLGIAGAYGLYRLTERWRMPRWQSGWVPWRYVFAWGIALGIACTVLVAVDPWQTLYSSWWAATGGLILTGASAAAFAACSAAQGVPRRVAGVRLAWAGATALMLAAGLVYPVLVTFDRTGGFRNAQTVDGLDFLRREDPAEHEAIQWLNNNVTGSPVIAEATGDDFSDAARISSRTGLPTIIGWVNHEAQWRGRPGPTDDGQPALVVRPFDLSLLYTTTDAASAQAVIEKYGVEYVYVGRLERDAYGTQGLAKFREFMDVAFENTGVTIFRVREEATALPRR